MVRIRSKIEELYTLDSPASGTPVQLKNLMGHINCKTTRRRFKTKRVMPKAISADTVAKLVSGITDPRDKALVLLMIDTGLRAGEVVDLDWDSIEVRTRQNSSGSRLFSGAGKTKNGTSILGRVFYFSTRTVDAIAAYLKERGDDGFPALFVNKSGTRLRSHALLHMMHGWCDRIGIERITPHQLRHYFASTLIGGGGSPMDLKVLLGVGSLNSILKYIPASAASEGAPA